MEITQWIEENQEEFTKISDLLWAYAETANKENKSAKLLAETLENIGFVVQRGVADIPTAFVASFAFGKPVIAILGEYDALPGLSHKGFLIENRSKIMVMVMAVVTTCLVRVRLPQP